VLAADERGDIGRERVGCQRSRGDDDGTSGAGRYAPDFFANDCDERMRGDRPRDLGGKTLAIDRQGGARRHTRVVRGAHDQRTKPPHLLLQQADGVIELVTAKGIAADELREAIRFVHGRRPQRAHLVEADGNARGGSLPRGFAACQTAADDGDQAFSLLPSAFLRRASIPPPARNRSLPCGTSADGRAAW
jgi:hypothetical protein